MKQREKVVVIPDAPQKGVHGRAARLLRVVFVFVENFPDPDGGGLLLAHDAVRVDGGLHREDAPVVSALSTRLAPGGYNSLIA